MSLTRMGLEEETEEGDDGERENFRRDGRKISLSLVSEILRRNSNEGLRWDREEGRRRLERKILRTQIVQVVLGMTLLITTAVGLIEERTLFGLGFGIFTALASIISAVLGMVDWKARWSGAVNGLAFLSLIPTSVFMSLSLYDHFASSPNNLHATHNSSIPHNSTTLLLLRDTHMLAERSDGDDEEEETRKMSETIPILFAIQLSHIIPIGSAFIYNILLLRHLHHYTLI